MRILGIDQSLTASGIAIVDGGRFERLEVLKTTTRGHVRLDQIMSHCLDLAADADAVALEAPTLSIRGSASTGPLFGLFWMLKHALWKAGKEPIVVNPSQRAMYATGKGNANKDAVLAAVIRRYDDDRLVDNNIADAAVIAAMVARMLGEPVQDESGLPAASIQVLAKIATPDGLDDFVPDAMREDRAWVAVSKRVDASTLAALKALPEAGPDYAHALLDYVTERGYKVWPTQRFVACVHRLDAPTHSCGSRKCETDWALPADWERPVLLRSDDGSKWAVLAQVHADHGLPAPVGGGRRAQLHTTALKVMASE